MFIIAVDVKIKLSKLYNYIINKKKWDKFTFYLCIKKKATFYET